MLSQATQGPTVLTSGVELESWETRVELELTLSQLTNLTLNSNSAQTRLTARSRKPARSFSESSAVIRSGIYPDPNSDPNTKYNTINRKEKLVDIQETSKIWLTALEHEAAIKDISSKQWRNQNWDVYLNIEYKLSTDLHA